MLLLAALIIYVGVNIFIHIRAFNWVVQYVVIKVMLNRKFTFRKFHTVKNWYQFFTARENSVQIRHIFHTNISHFVKFAHVVKLYVAYMRNLHIDEIPPPPPPPNLLHFAFDSNSSHICQDFIAWFKQVTDKFHMFYS